MKNYMLLTNIFFSLFIVIALQTLAHAQAQAQKSEPKNISVASLDDLFLSLKQASNETEAREYESQIWQRWFQSGDDAVDKLMKEASRKRSGYDFNGAIEILDKIITIAPDYSEVWNQHATVLFHQEKYEESLISIAKTLEIEPRHFGSLAGRAVIRLRQSKLALARQNIIEALKYHPFLRERSLFGL